MIEFLSETDFILPNPELIAHWIQTVIEKEGYEAGEITYTFCDDEFLHKINVEYLNHDTLTDIITFDYVSGKQVHAEIFISIERVNDNAQELGTSFENELSRVIIHGILHLVGYSDHSDEEIATMRHKEDFYIAMLN